MMKLWEANARVIKKAIEKAGIASEDIIGVGCTGHGKGLYLWGKDDKPCCNAIASTDSRANDYIRTWVADGTAEKASKKTLQYPIACQPVALLAWMKDNQPDVYSNIKYVFEAKDFTRFMLTGKAYAEMTDYSGTSLMNLLTGQFDLEILELFGIPEVFDKLPEIKNSYDLCGHVTAEAAQATGLKEGTPVCGGMFDIDACAISMDVSDEDKLCVITGTWSINEFISKTPAYGSKTTKNSFFCIPWYYLIEESSPTSAGNLEWYITNCMEADAQKSTGASIYDKINEMVQSVSPDESDIIFLPFLYGTNEDPIESAAFVGLNNTHDKRHMMRAIYEGVVFSAMTHIERLFAIRSDFPLCRIAGGAANS
ncbi:MAG TPA: FGGY-family carbohydrate kinase, partial [Clostridia bacterium]|nr:FGGY-family carbohydrate kinase [Clostridia bacterium]